MLSIHNITNHFSFSNSQSKTPTRPPTGHLMICRGTFIDVQALRVALLSPTLTTLD